MKRSNIFPVLWLGHLLAFEATAQPLPHGTYLTAPYGPGGTWNLYRTCSMPMTWIEAQELAEQTIDPKGNSGKKGHLVTISGAAENTFVYQKVLGLFIWIGLTDNERWGGKEAGTDRKGGWRWVTGEPYTFSTWRSAEPNAAHSTEDGVAMEKSCRWADWGIGPGTPNPPRHPSMIEWDTESPGPVEGAIPIGPVLPKKWPFEILDSKESIEGQGAWTVYSNTRIDGISLENVVAGFKRLDGTTGGSFVPDTPPELSLQ